MTYATDFQISHKIHVLMSTYTCIRGFPGSSVGEESACSAGDPASVPGWGRPPGEGNGNPLQYSHPENPTDGGAGRATVCGVAESDTT